MMEKSLLPDLKTFAAALLALMQIGLTHGKMAGEATRLLQQIDTYARTSAGRKLTKPMESGQGVTDFRLSSQQIMI